MCPFSHFRSCGPERPQVLILDNLSSHLTIDVKAKAIENNIHLFFIPANTSHLLQPNDHFFNLLKSKMSDEASMLGLIDNHFMINKRVCAFLFNVQMF